MMMMQAPSSAHIQRGEGGSCECAPAIPARPRAGLLIPIPILIPLSFPLKIPILILIPIPIPIAIPTKIPIAIPTKIPILILSDEKAIRQKGFTGA